MWKVLVVMALVGAALVVSIVRHAAGRWDAGTERLHARLEEARVPVSPAAYDPRELDSLPPPVQRYFRAVLDSGQAMIAGVQLRHTGTFNLSDTSQRWVPFTSEQRVVTRRPGFDWNARIRVGPGITVRVHDAYVAGEGILHAAVMALVPVASRRGTPDMAHGELMRYLAEAAWYPTALLPSQGVRWEPLDDRAARATLADHGVSASLVFRFGPDDLIQGVMAEGRGYLVADQVVQLPWVGRWTAYETRDGMLVPTEGEVAWVRPTGRYPYWRGTLAEIRYERAR
jgi:hypothetical protein